jgi:superfamily II DNA/RNA helicase
MYGGMDLAQRERIKQEFNDFSSPLRILVATDAASEGLNLQNTCRYVIHYEIPWNPMRLEQRNGRVDRHGQARDVHVFHFVSDEIEDQKFLARVGEKVNQVREDLGSVSKVIDAAVLEYFMEGPLPLEQLEERVEQARRSSVESEDLSARARGSLEEQRARCASRRARKGVACLSSSSILHTSSMRRTGG